MPYFNWRGVDLHGITRRGTVFAPSEKDLDTFLFKRDIALLGCRTWPYARFFSGPLGLHHTLEFFRQFATLLNAGVQSAPALSIMAEQQHHPRLQEITHTLAQKVASGLSLSTALAQHPTLFTPLMTQMVTVGQETGMLGPCLQAIAQHLEQMQELHKKLRTAALMPLITLGFFCGISLLIFMFVIPRFSAIFLSAQQELPTLTRSMLKASAWICSWHALATVTALGALSYIVGQILAHGDGKKWLDKIVMRTPYINELVKNAARVSVLRSLALLVRGGMPLVPALRVARGAVGNSVLHESLHMIEKDVEAGSSLSESLAFGQQDLFDHNVRSLVRVAEESGTLSTMLGKAADAHQESLDRSLRFITTLLQPLLMIILGLLVALLIFAIYLPVFSLSNLVG